MKKLKDDAYYSFVKGCRTNNGSVKIYHLKGSEKYLIIKSKYLLGFRIKKEKIFTDSIEKAEDCINDLKFDNYIEKVERYWY